MGDQLKGITVPNRSIYPQRGRIRETDLNMDGYPDVFITLNFHSNTLGKDYSQSYVLINSPCSTATNFKCPDHLTDMRVFIQSPFSNSINTEAGAVSTMLVPTDIDEDGKMDMIV